MPRNKKEMKAGSKEYEDQDCLGFGDWRVRGSGGERHSSP